MELKEKIIEIASDSPSIKISLGEKDQFIVGGIEVPYDHLSWFFRRFGSLKASFSNVSTYELNVEGHTFSLELHKDRHTILKDGQVHCLYGPAKVFNDGFNVFFKKDKIHNIYGPSTECKNNPNLTSYYLDGNLKTKIEWIKESPTTEIQSFTLFNNDISSVVHKHYNKHINSYVISYNGTDFLFESDSGYSSKQKSLLNSIIFNHDILKPVKGYGVLRGVSSDNLQLTKLFDIYKKIHDSGCEFRTWHVIDLIGGPTSKMSARDQNGNDYEVEIKSNDFVCYINSEKILSGSIFKEKGKKMLDLQVKSYIRNAANTLGFNYEKMIIAAEASYPSRMHVQKDFAGRIVNISFFQDGNFHRPMLGYPTIMTFDKDGNLKVAEYYSAGKRHSSSTPAIVEFDAEGSIARKQYWLRGSLVNQSEMKGYYHSSTLGEYIVVNRSPESGDISDVNNAPAIRFLDSRKNVHVIDGKVQNFSHLSASQLEFIESELDLDLEAPSQFKDNKKAVFTKNNVSVAEDIEYRMLHELLNQIHNSAPRLEEDTEVYQEESEGELDLMNHEENETRLAQIWEGSKRGFKKGALNASSKMLAEKIVSFIDLESNAEAASKLAQALILGLSAEAISAIPEEVAEKINLDEETQEEIASFIRMTCGENIGREMVSLASLTIPMIQEAFQDISVEEMTQIAEDLEADAEEEKSRTKTETEELLQQMKENHYV